jgi:hypothetical protein
MASLKRIRWTEYAGGGAAGRIGSCTLEVYRRTFAPRDKHFAWWGGGVQGVAPTAAKAKRAASKAVLRVVARGGCD